jgi:hypothetical protein
MDRYYSAQSVSGLTAAEWEVLYLLYDALDQLRKMTLSFSELRYLAVEHTEEQIRAAVVSLLDPAGHGKPFDTPLIVQIPNLANLPIYRVTPRGRDLVMSQKGLAETGSR